MYANFGERHCRECSTGLSLLSEDEIVERITVLSREQTVDVYAPVLHRSWGSHSTLLQLLSREFGPDALRVDGKPLRETKLDPRELHDIEIRIASLNKSHHPKEIRTSVQTVKALSANAVVLTLLEKNTPKLVYSFAPVCARCGTWYRELESKHFHQTCPFCSGKGCAACNETGLHPEAASVTWKDFRFPELLSKTVREVQPLFSDSGLPNSARRLVEEIQKRLEALDRVGLSYISLDRPSPSLSRGECQRVRLAAALTGRLEDILYVLDEPTIGQHPADVKNLIPGFRDLAGPVVYVEHDRTAAAYADHAVDIGPGAGDRGGKIIFSGTPAELWKADTPTGRWFSLKERIEISQPNSHAKSFLTIKGAYKHNLRDIDVQIPREALTVVTGVSGSGKSTLVEEVLARTLDQKKPVGCKSYEGPWMKVVMVDQGPIGKNPRSTPATYTKLSDIIRDMYAGMSGLSPSHFSFNRPEGACPACGGMGAVEVKMTFLSSTWIVCSYCEGKRFNDHVLEKKLKIGKRHYSISDFYQLPAAEALAVLRESPLEPRHRREAEGFLEALLEIGLGYLPLGQPSPTLSGGEAQRIKLAKYLGRKKLSQKIIILDEPSTGLHSHDLAGLLQVLTKLAKAGGTIVVVEHNLDFIRSADWLIDLGPGAGPMGGKILYTGPPDGILKSNVSLTGRAFREESEISPNDSHKTAMVPSSFIKIRGASANNLRHVDVDIPKHSLVVVTGISGSGKSSLVHDVLEAEARRRFLETLSLYERQGLKEGPEAPIKSLSGLGVCLTVTPDRKLYDRRSTVGTATELWHHLAVLFSHLGERSCLECGTQMIRNEQWSCPRCGVTDPVAPPGRFSPATYAAACTTCQGLGTLQAPKPEKLIRQPHLPLCGGAMYSPGFFPKGYLCKPGNGGYDIVRAFARRHGFDPEVTPWNRLSPNIQNMFLFGDPEPLPVMFKNPKGRTNNSIVTFNGFYGWIRDWDVGGTYSDIVPCPDCKGARLRPQYLAVTLGGFNIYQLSEQPLSRLREFFNRHYREPEKNLSSDRGQNHLHIIKKRLGFLERVGLGYLHLNRVSATLSAGEAQRVKLAGLLGSGLTSLTVLLDEPTRGLHPREVNALAESLMELKGEGNTVVVVEHDPGIIGRADYIIDMGPSAGTGGGRVSAQGTPEEIAGKRTVTGDWLQGKKRCAVLRQRREPGKWMTITGACENNLKGESVRIPRNLLTGICGVSGSGKSTLLMDTLGRVLVPVKHTTSVAREPLEPGKHEKTIGFPSRTVLVDQSKTGVQSPAAFLDLVQPLIKLYAQSEDARALGLDEAALGKKCSACRGSGMMRLDMGFLPDIRSQCESCDGTGLAGEIREVKLNGYSLPHLNRLTIDSVYRLFMKREKIAKPLKAAMDVGLGYLVLSQPGISLSGGEAQRLKIARELSKKTNGETLYILDEPTVGQHMEDIDCLNRVLHRLVDQGNSVIIIEHHPHLLAACDWLLELGPGGGPDGGRIIASGTPENIATMNTPTAPYIKSILDNKGAMTNISIIRRGQE